MRARSHAHLVGMVAAVDVEIEARAAAGDAHVEAVTRLGRLRRRRLDVEVDGVAGEGDGVLELGAGELQVEHAAARARDRALEAVRALALEAHVPQVVVLDPHVVAGAGGEVARLADERMFGIERLASGGPSAHEDRQGHEPSPRNHRADATTDAPDQGRQILPRIAGRRAPVTDGRLAGSA